jgi:hypothetical protein
MTSAYGIGRILSVVDLSWRQATVNGKRWLEYA